MNQTYYIEDVKASEAAMTMIIMSMHMLESSRGNKLAQKTIIVYQTEYFGACCGTIIAF